MDSPKRAADGGKVPSSKRRAVEPGAQDVVSLLGLPDDSLSVVFSYVPRSEWPSLRATCKRILEILCQKSFVAKTLRCSANGGIFHQRLAFVVGRYPLLTDLALIDPPRGRTTDNTFALLATSAYLRVFQVDDFPLNDLDVDGLCRCSQLTSLSMNRVGLNDQKVARLSQCLTQLASLNVATNEITLQGLNNLSTLPRLTSLDAAQNPIAPQQDSDDESMDDAGEDLIPLQEEQGIESVFRKFTQLRELYLFDNALPEAALQGIGTLTQLRALNLTGQPLTLRGIQALSALSNIETLHLDEVFENLNAAERRSAMGVICSFTSLTDLNIACNNLVAADAQLLSTLTALGILDISLNDIKQTGARVIERLTKLTSLDIRSNGLKVEVTRRLQQKLPGLVTFEDTQTD